MTKPITRDPIYRGRRHPSDIIELCGRWCITYRLSYRDLAEMMVERGVTISHATILRWVQRYVPEFEQRWGRYARRVHSSWRMDETAVSVRGGSHYLYRAVDKHGKTVESLLCSDRSESAARAFFSKALKSHQPRRPRKVNIDGSAASHRALRVLQEEDPAWRSVVIRSRRYLNNIVEQDHRAIKSRCAPMLAFKSFRSAAVTLAALSSHTVFASANSPLVVPGRGGCLLPSSFELVHWRVMTLRLKILRRNPRRGTATAPELRCSHADRHPTASSQATTLCTKVVGWRGACISW